MEPRARATAVAASQDYTHRSGTGSVAVRTIIRHYSTAVRKVTLQGSRVAFHDSKNTDQLAKILHYHILITVCCRQLMLHTFHYTWQVTLRLRTMARTLMLSPSACSLLRYATPYRRSA